jgi:hypothetical protein
MVIRMATTLDGLISGSPLVGTWSSRVRPEDTAPAAEIEVEVEVEVEVELEVEPEVEPEVELDLPPHRSRPYSPRHDTRSPEQHRS